MPDYFQLTFTDGPGSLYPGQIADSGTHMLNEEVRSYATETLVWAGRGVVKGALNTQADPLLTPYKVKQPLAGSVFADFVGIVVRSHSMPGDDVNQEARTSRATTMVPVAILGSKAIIGAEVPTGITVAHGDPVYMSVSHASIPVGKFSNAAATGLIAITGATWYGAAAAGTIGRIMV